MPARRATREGAGAGILTHIMLFAAFITYAVPMATGASAAETKPVGTTGQRHDAGVVGTPNAAGGIQARQALERSAIPFVGNKGQWDEKIRYALAGGGMSVGLMNDGIIFQASRAEGEGDNAVVKRASFTAFFSGGNAVTPAGIEQSSAKIRSYRGSDTSKWQKDLESFGAVKYTGIYEGVDLVVRAGGGGVVCRYEAGAGVSAAKIATRYEGLESLSVDEAGRVHLKMTLGEFVSGAPAAYQERDGQRTGIDVKYRRAGEWEIGFEIVGAVDGTLPLVIEQQAPGFPISAKPTAPAEEKKPTDKKGSVTGG